MARTLSQARPDLVAELSDKSLADTLSVGSHKVVRWVCPEGHEWDAPVYSRVAGNGCPYCSGRLPVVGVTDLATTHPELAAELVDQSLATRLAAKSNRKVRWRCALGHEWDATVANRTAGKGCPYCANRRLLVGFNDMATTHPDLAAELADRGAATKLMAGHNGGVRWRCKEGHEWVTSPNSRVNQSVGCPYCSGKKVTPGMNDLATTHPDLAAQLVDQSLATKLSAGSGKRLRWRCERGHEWDATVYSRKTGLGCPICSNKQVLVGYNDLATTDPEIAAELVRPEDGQTVTRSSHRKMKWRCSKGHEWAASVAGRCGRDRCGCPVCSPRVSRAEQELRDVVRKMLGPGVRIRFNDRRVIAPLELDLYVPSLGVAFEFNGVWWHSEEAGKGRMYHRDKLLACKEHGITLVSIWEDTWRLHRSACLSMVANKLGVFDELRDPQEAFGFSNERRFARRLSCGEVSGRVAGDFLDAHHVQGRVAATRHFALFDGDVLVAVMSVRSPRGNARMRRSVGEWEVQRYATEGHVVGGFSKLLRHAERTLLSEGADLRRWVSFSDNEVSSGKMYQQTQFFLDIEIAPNYKYAGAKTGYVRKPKEGFQKAKFRDRDDLVFEEGMTERELAQLNGLFRCWDSGKLRWVKRVV